MTPANPARADKRLPLWAIGLAAVLVVAVAFYGAFTKSLPWAQGYQIKAVFEDAQNLRVNSPVRIAGVEVGKVKSVEHLTQGGEGEEAAVVTMEILDNGRPIMKDATMKLRPRLFLEGNLFVDTKPGTPTGEEAPDGFTIPINQTSISVQLDQVLSSLQSDVRQDLQLLLHELGDAFIKYGGAEGFREIYRTSPAAFRSTSQVNEATLGTAEHDLSSLVVNLDEVVEGLGRNASQLQDLVSGLRVFTGSFAAEAQALELAIIELPLVLGVAEPALRSLNAALPPLRAFAREATPGVRSTSSALDAAIPWIAQVRKLVRRKELRGLIADLRITVPKLAAFVRVDLKFEEQTRALSSCFNEVIIPWGFNTVPDPVESASGPVYKETGYGLVGLAGESRSGDGNGQYIRVGAGGGLNTVSFPAAVGRPESAGVLPFEILGAIPGISSSAKTPFRPDQPCENQDPPDLRAGAIAAPPTQSTVASRSGGSAGQLGAIGRRIGELYTDLIGGRNRTQTRESLLDLLEFQLGGQPAYEKALRSLGYDGTFEEPSKKVQKALEKVLGGSG
jgi:phospholipid/cholesterol/gamma-HCH transport system substrate-binding protein